MDDRMAANADTRARGGGRPVLLYRPAGRQLDPADANTVTLRHRIRAWRRPRGLRASPAGRLAGRCL